MMKAATILAVFLLVIAFKIDAQGLFQTRSSETPFTSANALSEAQRQAIKRINISSKKKAALPALRLAGIVRQIYLNMLADKPDEKLRARLSAEMKETTWKLLTIKGQAIRETVNVLTPGQKQLIKSEMRKPGAPTDLGEVIEHTFKLVGEK
jgi:hypothetical protein